jgi:iron complex outermembrane receptor protein
VRPPLLLLVVAVLPFAGFGQESRSPETRLPEIVVRPEDNPDRIPPPERLGIRQPYSVDRLDREQIEDRDLRDLTDLQSQVPNAIARSGGTRSLNDVFGFRGMVNNPFFGEPAVPVYVDDVPYGLPSGTDYNLFAADRIEIFRGAQFTRFGRHGPAGLIAAYTREPGSQIHAEGAAGYATFNERYGRLLVDGPLGEHFAFSLSGLYSASDGFLYNRTYQRKTDEQQALSGRLSLYWKPSEQWNVQLILSVQESDDGVQRLTSLDDSPYIEDDDFAGVTHSRSDLQALRVRYEGERFRLTSVTARRKFSLDPASLDLDFSALNFASVTVDVLQEQYTQEVRLESLPGAEWEWLAGAYLSRFEFDAEIFDQFYAFNDIRRSNQEFLDRTAALFGEVTAPLTEKWKLTLGGRIESLHKKADRTFRDLGGVMFEDAQDRTVSNVSPMLRLTYKATKDVMVYVSSGLTYRAGAYSGFNFDSKFRTAVTERTWANEVGAKAAFFDRKLSVTLAGFWNEVENYQIEKYLPGGFGVFTVPEVVTRGVEVEVLAQPWSGLELAANFGFTDAEFRTNVSTETGEDLSGNRPPYIPIVTAAFATTYRHTSGVMGRLEWLLTGKTYFDERNQDALSQNGYGVLNARLGYEQKNWAIYAYVKNLNDAEYYNLKIYPFGVGSISEPRTFGMMATFDF